MLSALTRIRALAPPRRNAGRWLPPWPSTARTDVAVTDTGDVTPRELVWGYAIRREWPDGAHDLFGFTPDAETARRRLDRDQGYWRCGPVRPAAVYLVAANAADVSGHPVDGCRRSGCPDVVDRGQR